MRSLLIRIFLSFWLIIGIITAVAAVGGYWYAERMHDAIEDFDFGDVMREASTVLAAEGRAGLESWLRERPRSSGLTLYVLPRDGRDILGRRVPWHVARMVDRHRRHMRWHDDDSDQHPNLRRARPLSQLVAANGEVYTLHVAHDPRPPLFANRAPAGIFLLLLAVIVSAAVSLLLARAITRPVTKLRDATVAFADGQLDLRVADSIGGRRDELGRLARDFDAMAAKLQHASAQQTELSRNISHELRSPLARMRVALELARRRTGELPEFDRIDQEAERLDNLIGQILELARLDSGSDAQRQPIDLADLIREVVENVNDECRADGLDGIGVDAELDASPVVQGYRDALTSAVENIVRNAVHHSPADGRVIIRLGQPNDRSATIEIIDRGKGVPVSDLPRLFDAFFHTRDSAEGTGLGLAIAKRAIRINGGEVTAENRDEGGLKVTITLPNK